MPAFKQRQTGCKRNRHQLGKYYEVKSTEERQLKKFSPHHIDAGNKHHHEHPCQGDPFKQAAKPTIKRFEFI
jgi:hypothetical protein